MTKIKFIFINKKWISWHEWKNWEINLVLLKIAIIYIKQALLIPYLQLGLNHYFPSRGWNLTSFQIQGMGKNYLMINKTGILERNEPYWKSCWLGCTCDESISINHSHVDSHLNRKTFARMPFDSKVVEVWKLKSCMF